MAREYAEDIDYSRKAENINGGVSIQIDDDRPLASALSRLHNQIDSLHKTIEATYSRLDHLVFHGPEMPADDSEGKPMAAHSDTVLRVERLADQVQAADAKLDRLLRMLEA
jgi:hypothetical protein